MSVCDCPDFTEPVDTRHVCPVHGPLYSEPETPSPVAFEWRDSQPIPETSSPWDNPS